MERELLLVLLGSSGFVLTAWSSATAFDRVGFRPASDEQRSYRNLIAPVFIGALAIAFFVGWAAQEPDPADERANAPVIATATMAAAVLLRACWRALASLRAASSEWHPIAAVGILRPRVELDPSFGETLAPGVLRAALAHEAAHVRSRDPLRMWLGQIATDLQWPAPGATRRQRRWLAELELLRDDEAVRAGADPADLAAAIVAAVRWGQVLGTSAMSSLHGDGLELEARIRRLLAHRGSDRADECDRSKSWRRPSVAILLALTLCGAAGLGTVIGEDVVRGLPGMSTALQQTPDTD